MEAKSTTGVETAETVLVTTRLSPESASELAQCAKAADRTIAAELRRAVRFYLESIDKVAA